MSLVFLEKAREHLLYMNQKATRIMCVAKKKPKSLEALFCLASAFLPTADQKRQLNYFRVRSFKIWEIIQTSSENINRFNLDQNPSSLNMNC